jgi:hypothetical protein
MSDKTAFDKRAKITIGIVAVLFISLYSVSFVSACKTKVWIPDYYSKSTMTYDNPSKLISSSSETIYIVKGKFTYDDKKGWEGNGKLTLTDFYKTSIGMTENKGTGDRRDCSGASLPIPATFNYKVTRTIECNGKCIIDHTYTDTVSGRVTISDDWVEKDIGDPHLLLYYPYTDRLTNTDWCYALDDDAMENLYPEQDCKIKLYSHITPTTSYTSRAGGCDPKDKNSGIKYHTTIVTNYYDTFGYVCMDKKCDGMFDWPCRDDSTAGLLVSNVCYEDTNSDGFPDKCPDGFTDIGK